MTNEATLSLNGELVSPSLFIPEEVSVPAAPGKPAPMQSPAATAILVITSYPPRECGIATYSQDLREALMDRFGASIAWQICALETDELAHTYPEEVRYVLYTSQLGNYEVMAHRINEDREIALILVQHEFGLYGGEYGQYLLALLCSINKPIITTFHTLLPQPDEIRQRVIQNIARESKALIVMTRHSAQVLENDYHINPEKIQVIAHGTHLADTTLPIQTLHQLKGRVVLTTFGLLGPGKSIETALEALPEIIKEFPEVVYLVIGKTHPGVFRREGEQYREFLQQKVMDLQLQNHVQFINRYLALTDILNYLQRTDIYLFTSKDPHQAVSGTFAYAMGCGCPVISTPIPHAREILDGAGMIIDFQAPEQLAKAAIHMISHPPLMMEMKMNALHKIRPTAWPNAALAHVALMQKICHKSLPMVYRLPAIDLRHLNLLTTSDGIIQFSQLSVPDLATGYTLDDNARALIVICRHYTLTDEIEDLSLIQIYLTFITYCQRKDGSFINYVDPSGVFPARNSTENLEDSNGRAIWALGELLNNRKLSGGEYHLQATKVFRKALRQISKWQSPRAIAFAIKGLHAFHQATSDSQAYALIVQLADNLVSKYRGVSNGQWNWFEKYLTYANSVLPEALLCAYLTTGSELFRSIAHSSFDHLLSILFKDGSIKVVSHQGWLHPGVTTNTYGEQPIDVAYTILALHRFYQTDHQDKYLTYLTSAFDWFLGKNHLHQIMYNPVTAGCYDGLEESHINLNQGAESTLSYLLARLTMESYVKQPLPVEVGDGKNAMMGARADFR
jgi:glycosyltransferase involved in cell wall biosynthesis